MMKTQDIGAENLKTAVEEKKEVMVPDSGRGNQEDIEPLLSSSGEERKESCQFNKRGACKEHIVLGIRTKLRRRAWAQKKYGFGWSGKVR